MTNQQVGRTVETPAPAASGATARRLAAHRLTCVRGERTLFENVNLQVGSGQVLRVKGPNGSGKTSLLRILCGLATPAEGEIRWNDRPIRSSREEFHRDLAYIGHLPGAKDDLTALENLQVAATFAGVPADAAACESALARFGIADHADYPLKHLSAGQRRRVALGRLALAASIPLWILDEPFNALDVAAVEHLSALIGAHVAGGGIAVMTTHMEVAIPGVETLAVDLGPVRHVQ